MASRARSETAPVGAPQRPPLYVDGSSARDVWAHFPSGSIVRAVRGRARRYPGLCSEAPPTLAFYDALIQLAPHAEHVLDVGCGSGDGTRRLAEHFDKVTGIDADADALAFAKEWAPFGRYVLSDLAEPPPIAEADAAVFADVLSHARRPGQLLRSVRRKLRAKSKVVLAEPAAFVTQSLSVPVRRAFSKRNMVALLARSGYACSGWICDQGSFLACVAEPVFESATERLVEGELAAERGDLTAALAGYRAAERSARTEVQREAVLGQGRVLFAAGDGDGSAKAFLRSREMDPKDSRGLAGLSQIVLASGDAHQALRIAVEAEDLEPTEAEAALALALAADALGLTEAFSSWRVVSRLCPDDPGIATKLARAAAERGDYAFCISVFERLRHYGDALGPAFHVTLAWLLMAQGRRSDAALEAQVAMALAPNDPAVLELWKSIEEERTSSG